VLGLLGRPVPPLPLSYEVDTPRPSPRTDRTRRVPHPVLIGHAASLSQVSRESAEAMIVQGTRPASYPRPCCTFGPASAL